MYKSAGTECILNILLLGTLLALLDLPWGRVKELELTAFDLLAKP